MSRTRKGLIMSIVNKLFRNFSEKKSRIPVVASALVLLVSASAFASDAPWDNTPIYKLNKEFRHNWNNVTDKAVTYDNDVLTVTLDYSMKGGEVDWARRGEEGFAQRWQVQSKKYTQANTIGWYTFSFKVAEDIDVPQYTLSFADFKRIIGRTDTGAPPISFALNNNRFLLGLSGSDKQSCKKRVSGAEECNNSEAYFLTLADTQALKGQWVDVVFRVEWKDEGSVAVWINNELRAEYYGNLRQGGTSFMYKVGSYRHHMKQATDRGIEILPVTVQYKAIHKGKTCDAVSELCSNLEQLTGSTNASKMKHIVKCGEGGPSSCRGVYWD